MALSAGAGTPVWGLTPDATQKESRKNGYELFSGCAKTTMNHDPAGALRLCSSIACDYIDMLVDEM